jgi:hypothetical protein
MGRRSSVFRLPLGKTIFVATLWQSESTPLEHHGPTVCLTQRNPIDPSDAQVIARQSELPHRHRMVNQF